MGTAKYFLFLQTVEALSFLALAWLCFRRSSAWRLAAFGAAVAGLVALVYAATDFELVYRHTAHLATQIYDHHLDNALRTARVAGLVVLVVGFLTAQRGDPPRSTSLYGG